MTYTVVNDALPTGATASNGEYINASGEVAGLGDETNSYEMGVTWDTSGNATVLPGILQWESFQVSGINASGDVVGTGRDEVGTANSVNALVWAPGATSPTVLSSANAGSSIDDEAYAINDSGVITGRSYSSTITYGNGEHGGTEGVVWNTAGDITAVLQSLGNSNLNGAGLDDYGESVNDSGVIGGSSNFEAVEWSRDGSILWHSPPEAQQHRASGVNVCSYITAVNASGAAIGYDGPRGGSQSHTAAYWSPTGVETLLAQPFGHRDGVLAINAMDRMVGLSGKRPVEWSDTGTATPLKELPGMTSGVATDINDNNQVVGCCNVTGSSNAVATYWSPTGKATNLDTILGPAWTDTVPERINNQGDICGTGIYNGTITAFELLCNKPMATDALMNQSTSASVIEHAHAALAMSHSGRG
jgi:hypothetical protein